MATDRHIDELAEQIHEALRAFVDKRLDILAASNRDLIQRCDRLAEQNRQLAERCELLEAQAEARLRAIK